MPVEQLLNWHEKPSNLLTCGTLLEAQAVLMGTYNPIAPSKCTPGRNSKYTVDRIYHQKVDCRSVLNKTLSYIHITPEDVISKTKMQKGQQCEISGAFHNHVTNSICFHCSSNCSGADTWTGDFYLPVTSCQYSIQKVNIRLKEGREAIWWEGDL